MTYTIDMLIDKIKEVGKSYDLDKIQAAYELAEKAHDGVFRSSGEPYITHPVAVAYILVEQFCMDTDTICAALLHDVNFSAAGFHYSSYHCRVFKLYTSAAFYEIHRTVYSVQLKMTEFRKNMKAHHKKAVIHTVRHCNLGG